MTLSKQVSTALSFTEKFLERKKKNIDFSKVSALDFEEHVVEGIEAAVAKNNLSFKVKLKSNLTFPDIICYTDKSIIGVEVKTTKVDKWLCTGNSIKETTRVDGVQEIFLFFGKLGGDPAFRFSTYSKVLEEVKVTHSPRYFINMKCAKKNTIFEKLGVSYDEFRESQSKFRILKKYYRSLLKEGEELWWDGDIEEEGIELGKHKIRLWNEASQEEKDEIRAKAFVLFTELFRTDRFPKKYNRLTSWIVSQYSLVTPSLRDSFSAGGKIKLEGHTYPQVVNSLVESYEFLEDVFKNIDEDDLSFYWGVDSLPKSKANLRAHWEIRMYNNLALNIDEKGIKNLRKYLGNL
jgi:hypothetical protein